MAKFEIKEFVLPDGRFARFRPPNVFEYFMSSGKPTPEFFAHIASYCVEIDQQKFTAAQWLAMDYDDVAPVVAHMNEFFQRTGKTIKGVA